MKKIGVFSIFGKKIPVYETDKLDQGLAGLYDYGNQTIQINKDLPVELLKETLLHEFFHASFDRLSYKQSGLPHALEEVMIDQLAKALNENFHIALKKKKK